MGRTNARGYGLEILQRFLEEVAFVEFGGPPALRSERLQAMQCLSYNDLTADRPIVAAVQAMEALLQAHASGHPGGVVQVNHPAGGLVLHLPGQVKPTILYPEAV